MTTRKKKSESRNEEMDYDDCVHKLKPAPNLSTRRKEKILLKPLTSHLQRSRFICTFFFLLLNNNAAYANSSLFKLTIAETIESL